MFVVVVFVVMVESHCGVACSARWVLWNSVTICVGWYHGRVIKDRLEAGGGINPSDLLWM